MLHSIFTEQVLKSNRQTIWNFISNPHNLAYITPSYMGFDIVGKVNAAMYPGQIIEYKVKPLMNIKLYWVTEITHVKEGHYFVDEQRFGPYAFWHHQHTISEVEGGIKMNDEVHYKLPLGALGKMVNGLLVKRQLDEIFNYRRQKLDEIFNLAK